MSRLGYLFFTKSSLHKIAWDLDVRDHGCWKVLACERATQATPPPPWVATKFGASHVGSCQIEQPKQQNESPNWGAILGGEGKSATFQITQQRSNISRSLFHTEDVYSIPCPLLTAVSKFAYLLSTSCEERKCALCSEEGPIKRRQIWQPFSVGYTKFYRQHRCGGKCIQEQSRQQQHTWNSNLFVIFPAETTAAQSLHFQHLMWTEVISSRRL